MADGSKHSRQPFTGLVAAAIAGILLGEMRWLPLEMWLGGIGLVALLWAVTRRTVALWLLVLVAFAGLHGRQFTGNPGRELAAALGDRRVLVEGEGRIVSPPVESNTGYLNRVESTFAMEVTRWNDPSLRQVEGIRLQVSWPGPAPTYGATIRFAGTLENEPPPRNPGEFDYADWLARRQIFSRLNIRVPKDGQILQDGPAWSPVRIAEVCRHWMEKRLVLDLENEPEIAGVIQAMVLGTTGDDLDDIKLAMQKTGTLHLFAVSGLQVSMLAAMLLFGLQICRLPRRAAVLVTIPVILFYALITGWSASSVRAAVMTSIFLGAILLDRPAFTMNTLSASAFLLLLADTNQLFVTGFQLSYCVVLAIVLLTGPITRWLQNFARPDPFIPRKLLTAWQKGRWVVVQKISATLALTIAAWIGSMPLTAWYFNLFSPVALLANLIIVPISFVVLLLGVFSLLASISGNWLSILFNNSNWGMVQILVWLIHWFVSWPTGWLHIGGRWLEWTPRTHVTVLDLGAGGSTVIESAHGCWLVDVGSETSYRRIVSRYLQKRGINSVNAIFLTHGDSNHVSGIRLAMRDFPDAPVYVAAVSADSLVYRRLELTGKTRLLQRGDTLPLGPDASLEILHPGPTVDSGRADDQALVLRLQVAGRKMLLTSDSGFPTERELLEKNDLAADLLAMGRHRSDFTGSPDFLRRVAPRLFICSSASFPSSEEVPAEWPEFCQKNGVALFRQDQTGAVEIRFSPTEYEARGFLNGQSVRLSPE